MIVPVIVSLNPVADGKMYTWVFIKAVSFARKYHWPVIAQKQYFDDIENIKGFFSENLLEHFEYEMIGKQDLQKIVPVVIPEEIEKRYIDKFPSQTDAYLSSIKNAWDEMEQFFEQAVDRLEKDAGEKIEAFYTLPNQAFLENAARRKQIPVIHFEWGPFRPAMYRKTAYFDFYHVVMGLRERYENFIKNQEDKQVPMFTRQEILALFLEKDYLQYVYANRQPSYEMGVATGYTTIGEYSAYNMVSLMEIQSKVAKKFHEDEVCWRMHPEDPQHAQLSVKNRSDHKNTADFILDCKRVLSMSSNVIFEAMMFDRAGYDIGFSHYSFQGNHKIDLLEDKKPDIRFLNFAVFSYFIPYEFLNSPEYIRFRLSRPAETEIYNYHLHYYLNVWGIKRDILKEKDKLQIIMQARGFEKTGEQAATYLSEDIWFGTEKEICDNIQILRLKHKLSEMQKEHAQLKMQIREIAHKVEEEMRTAVLYLDMGQGFSEKDKLFADYEVKDGVCTAAFDIPQGVARIRYDPCLCGEKALYFKDLMINGKENCYESFNIQRVNGKDTFIMKNPYFILKELYQKVQISIKVYAL